jgi:hypothetical protein
MPRSASVAVTSITNLVFDSPLFFGRRVIDAVRCVYQRGDCDHQGDQFPRVASIARMDIRLAKAIFLFLLAMSFAFALRATLIVLGL